MSAYTPFPTRCYGARCYGLLACGLVISCLTAPADATTITASDVDNGVAWTAVPDDAMPRPQFATWLANEINNRVYHGGQALEFDRPGGDHHFGHSIMVPVGDIDLRFPVTLTIKLFGNSGSNDGLGFQAYDGPVSSTSVLTAPSMSYTSGIVAFNNTYGSGGSVTASPISVDLRSITAVAGPLSSQNIASTVNNLGYLDVWVADDSAVDYLTLNYTSVPEPTSACVALLAIGGVAAGTKRAQRD
jgi:hypothetical protein